MQVPYGPVRFDARQASAEMHDGPPQEGRPVVPNLCVRQGFVEKSTFGASCAAAVAVK
jgi:hypothetical protein